VVQGLQHRGRVGMSFVVILFKIIVSSIRISRRLDKVVKRKIIRVGFVNSVSVIAIT
jgi:hypothetical protein